MDFFRPAVAPGCLAFAVVVFVVEQEFAVGRDVCPSIGIRTVRSIWAWSSHSLKMSGLVSSGVSNLSSTALRAKITELKV